MEDHPVALPQKGPETMETITEKFAKVSVFGRPDEVTGNLATIPR